MLPIQRFHCLISLAYLIPEQNCPRVDYLPSFPVATCAFLAYSILTPAFYEQVGWYYFPGICTIFGAGGVTVRLQIVAVLRGVIVYSFLCCCYRELYGYFFGINSFLIGSDGDPVFLFVFSGIYLIDLAFAHVVGDGGCVGAGYAEFLCTLFIVCICCLIAQYMFCMARGFSKACAGEALELALVFAFCF